MIQESQSRLHSGRKATIRLLKRGGWSLPERDWIQSDEQHLVKPECTKWWGAENRTSGWPFWARMCLRCHGKDFACSPPSATNKTLDSGRSVWKRVLLVFAWALETLSKHSSRILEMEITVSRRHVQTRRSRSNCSWWVSDALLVALIGSRSHKWHALKHCLSDGICAQLIYAYLRAALQM